MNYAIIRHKLLTLGKKIQETSAIFQNLHTVEVLRHAEPRDWHEITRDAFNDERAARQEHRAVVESLAWLLDQNHEYY